MKRVVLPLFSMLLAVLAGGCTDESTLNLPVTEEMTTTESPMLAASSVADGSCTQGTPPTVAGVTNTGTIFLWNASCDYISVYYVYDLNNNGYNHILDLSPQWGYYFSGAFPGVALICVGPRDKYGYYYYGRCYQGPPQPPYGESVPIPIYIFTPPSPRRIAIGDSIKETKPYRPLFRFRGSGGGCGGGGCRG